MSLKLQANVIALAKGYAPGLVTELVGAVSR